MSGNELELQKNLPRCISMLYDMELNQYLMTREIAQLNEKISSLGRERRISDAVRGKNQKSVIEYVLKVGSLCAFAAMPIGAIYYFTTNHGFFDKLFSIIEGPIVFGFFGAIIGAVAGLIIGIIKKGNEDKALNARFESDKSKHEKAVALDSARLKREKMQKALLTAQRDKLMRRRSEAQNKLAGFYNSCGIDSNYRNLVPIGYMNDFIRLGISKRLEGSDGLYYLIRHELRMDQLQYTLEEISYKLDTIIDRQSRIYSDLSEMNQKCSDLFSRTVKMAEDVASSRRALSSIEESSALAAYNTSRIEAENRYQTFMLALGL